MQPFFELSYPKLRLIASIILSCASVASSQQEKQDNSKYSSQIHLHTAVPAPDPFKK